ncbi:T9SS type A sorting domain-containing protein [Chryseobacterium sp. Leaf405]|uniref:T9SS type A sorting domain-containing protein n=1 Tax=Chryseobacterium sp. Leaf405 TaxID=1736367 RepID=UPI0009E68819|nr:T9SS type A sorting domain-containing protein [Chryseobacterium sp. Leaf405]
MKKLLLMCFGLLLGTLINAQITLGSGTSAAGTSTSIATVPWSTYYGYSYAQQILTKANINASAAGNITGLKFYMGANSSITNSNDVVVYVGLTNKDSFTSTADWIPTTALTQVYNGTVTNNAGVVEVTFSAPFAYDNISNLVIAVDENKSGDNGGEWFYTYTNTTNQTLYYRNDTTNPNPSGTLPAGTRSATQSVVTLLGLTPLAPPCPVVSAPAAAATGVSLLPTISWATSGSATSYKISLGTTPGGIDIMNMVDVGNVTTYTLTNALTYSTQYYYTVYATNSAGNSTGCTERSFTTLPLPCPTISAPATAQQGLPVRPTFTWAAVTGVSGYRLNIGTSAGSSDVLSNFDLGNVVTYTLTPAQQLTPNTQYYYTITSYAGSTVSTGCAERNFKTANAAIPVNDECANAATLTVNSDLACGATTAGNTLGATNSLAAAPCSGNPDDDVWYKFTATNSTHYVRFSNIVATGTTSSTDMYVQVLSGTCGSLASVVCSDSDTTTIVSGLTPGTTYYVRAYTYGGVGNNASFNICVGTPPPAPANDECINVTTVTVNPDLNCGSVVSGTTVSATSSNLAVAPCTGTADDDVWYSFTATSTVHRVSLSNVVSTGISSSTSLYTQVFSGACGSLTSVQCGTTNTTNLTGLTVGQTYYVRVYNSNTNSATATYANTFDFCVGTPPPPPANDVCSGAISLTVGNNFAANPMVATNISATTDSTTTCQSNRNNNVWFSVVVPASGSVTVETAAVTGSGFIDSVLSAHSGICGSLANVACNDDISSGTNNFSKISLTGQTPGATLYFSVWRYSLTGADGQFRISAYDSSIPLATGEVKSEKDNLKIYPNPFVDVLSISDSKNVKSIFINDIAGRLVKTITSPESTLYLGELKSGMYLVTLQMNDGSKQTIKAIKK